MTSPERSSSSSRLWRGAKLVIGAVLVPLGIVGLFLPVLQGVLFLVVGLLLLSDEIPLLARLRESLRRRHPRPFEEAERLGERLSSWYRGRFAPKRHKAHPSRDLPSRASSDPP